MLLAARDTLSFTKGLSYDESARDRRTEFSGLKAVEIMGEAAAHVSEDSRQMHQAIPCREIVSMRNRLVHSTSTCGSSGIQRAVTCWF